MSKKRKIIHNKVVEICKKRNSNANVDYISEEKFNDKIGLTHTNISVIHFPNTTTISEITDITEALQNFGFVTTVEKENSTIIVNVMYTYTVYSEMGLT